jgi:hypothetical protein
MGELVVRNLPFVGGVDEKTSKEWNDPAKQQASIVNGNFEKVGSISKRLGVQHLSNALVPGSAISAISSGVRCTGWSRSSLTVCSEGGLYSYSDAEGGVVGVANLPDVACVRRPIVTAPTRTNTILCDLPYGGTTLRIALYWDVSYNVKATVYDADTGDIVREPVTVYTLTGSLAAGTIPVVVSAFYLPNSDKTKIFVQDNANSTVYAIDYSPATNSFSSASSLFTVAGVGSVGIVDIMPFDGDPAGGYVAAYSTSTTNLRVRWYSSANAVLLTKDVTLTAGQTFAGFGQLYVTATYGASERVWVTYQTFQTPNYRLIVLCMSGDGLFTTQAGSPTVIAGPQSTTTLIISGTCRLGPDDLFINYRRQGITTDAQVGPLTCNGTWYRVHAAGTLTLAAQGPIPLGLFAVAKPFVANGQVHQAFYFNLYLQAGAISDDTQSQQITLYLCKYVGLTETTATTTSNIVLPMCTVAPRQVSANWQLLIDFFSLFRLQCMSNLQSSATRFACGVKTNGIETSALDGPLGPTWAVDFYFDDSSRRQLYQATELGTELSLSGGVPFVADGQAAFEDSFFHYPEFTYTKLGGSGITISGVYTYAVLYSYIDSAGLVHRSVPALTNAVTVPGNGTTGPIVHIMPLCFTFRDVSNPGTVFADVYRTQGNGATFYFLNRIVVSNQPTATQILYPSSGADNWSDASMIQNTTLLYTTGGVLDNVNPPSSSFQIAHRGRKAAVDETRRFVWFTSQYSEGEAPGFNEALVIPYPEGGDITAIRSMDDKFVAFKASSIWVMTGDGPADTGQGSDWSVPQAISTDVGCVNWQSVVLTPMGLMFKAPNGIYLLGRDLQVTFVGKAVIDLLTDFPVVTSATLVPNSTQVRFTCSSSDGTASTVAVYDYLLGQWTRHEYPQLSAPIASACLTFPSPQKFTLLTTDGQIWQERLPTDAQAYFDEDSSDNRHFVTTSVTVPWDKMQLQGYMRAKRAMVFGQQEDDCGLKMELAFNYDETVRQTATWYSYQLSELPIRGQVETHVAAAWNKSMSIQVTLSDLAGSQMTTGKGMRFVSLSLELENIGSRYRQVPVGGRQ